MNNLAIIPARGGSKRIPKKNIRDFKGQPIIGYSINAAISSGLFTEVMVSTDNKEIAAISKSFGANVPFYRSIKNSDDFATLSNVVDEVLNIYEERGICFTNVCCILPTAPFITKELLDKGFKLLIEGNFNSVRPVVEFKYPIQKAYRLLGSKIEMFDSENINIRSQDFEKAYHDSGLFYWIRANSKLSDGNKGAFVIPEHMCHDIDDLEDWKIAEIKHKIIFDHD